MIRTICPEDEVLCAVMSNPGEAVSDLANVLGLPDLYASHTPLRNALDRLRARGEVRRKGKIVCRASGDKPHRMRVYCWEAI